jgi:proline iminopeptidase
MEFSRLQQSSKAGPGDRYLQADCRACGLLDVGDGYRLYWEEYGCPEGEPVLVLHGGPGGASTPTMAQFFNPNRYRVIIYDQRGCGQSEPNVATAGPEVALAKNTTQLLIADIQKIRDAFEIKGKMNVFGGSWGSTLAMAYAIAYPQNCANLILRGIFLGQPEDLRYVYQGNAATFAEAPHSMTEPGAYISYPEAWSNFLDAVPLAERSDVMKSYKAVFDMKPDTPEGRRKQLDAAIAWSVWEGTISNAIPEPNNLSKFGDAAYALCFAQIEAHFFANQLFLEPDHIIHNLDRLVGVPIHIVHGRFDQVCPLAQASRLAAALEAVGSPPSSLVLTMAGHSATERENAIALTAIMDGLSALQTSP